MNLVLFEVFGDFFCKVGGESSSVSGADEEGVNGVFFGVELMNVFGSNNEEGGVDSAEDEALNVFDGYEA